MTEVSTSTKSKTEIKEILRDYELAVASREASLLGRKEVFMGKAKFGIFGDGKEVPQLAMAKVFRNGDFRSGYYRDQTFMFAIGQLTLKEYFAQLYANPDVAAEPASAGRSMNGHFATRLLDDEGHWIDQTSSKNSSADISPTAAQMPRLVGLAYASKLYRNLEEIDGSGFSEDGNEIAFGTIGNASTSEGLFFECMNAAGVLQVPMLMSVWDDDYGISVPQKYHTTKQSISDALSGFQRESDADGFEIFVTRGWDYEGLIDTYRQAEQICRDEHVPVLIHVKEATQPQGHSTSGSHERYKPQKRLQWEKEHDCIVKMREWMLSEELSTAEELDEIEANAKKEAKTARDEAWKDFISEIKTELREAIEHLSDLSASSANNERIEEVVSELKSLTNPIRSEVIRGVKQALRYCRGEKTEAKERTLKWLAALEELNEDRFSSYVYSQSEHAAVNVEALSPIFSEDGKMVDGREVLQACFDHALSRDKSIFAIGEDLGKIGDVNQGFAGLQEKHGELRVTDTGIREASIVGQGIGAALRGLRPIAEIQYLDYLLYALQTLSDDLATLQYRTKGGQKAPVIIRTRGHRLEGIWHSGSPMGMILNSLRGINVLVPRNMVKAAGFYNTMFQSDEPALIVECLNGYRLKERIPENVGEFTTPLGIPEVIREGHSLTIVTYGSMCRIVLEAADQLAQFDIECEVVDVQTLLPFDIDHKIVESVKKTNRVIFADEDVPGGASAYMMQKVLEEQDAYRWLDSKPITVTAKEHRPAYASDGDYFSKPNVETIFDAAYKVMSESDPQKYPAIY